MAKSKRNKVVSLTKVQKKTSATKEKLANDIREAATKYKHVFVIRVVNMRNNRFKDLRDEFQDSRFFLGKNKVMALALGTSEETEVVQGAHHIAECINGGSGLLFTQRDSDEIIQYFSEYAESNFARSGFVATEDFSLPAGPLEDQPFSMETQLRKLGLPTKLDNGIVVLEKDAIVCKKGDILTPNQAKLLELFGVEMAIMKVHILARLDLTSGEFEEYEFDEGAFDGADSDDDTMDD